MLQLVVPCDRVKVDYEREQPESDSDEEYLKSSKSELEGPGVKWEPFLTGPSSTSRSVNPAKTAIAAWR